MNPSPVKSALCFLAMASLAACGASPVARTTASEAASRAGPSATEATQLELTYLGVAGWQLRSSEHVLLIDPYFTRTPGTDLDAPLSPDLAAIDRFAPKRAEVILVGHSHYDHLLDVPTIAARTGAFVVGSQSTLNVARAAALPDARLRQAEPDHLLELPPFAVLPLASLHSLIGIPSVDIPSNIRLPLSGKAYGEGGTLAYFVTVNQRSVLFLDTANFIESALAGHHPDIAVIATGLREKVPDYTCRLMRVLENPKLVLPTHFDAHYEPLADERTPIAPAQLAEVAKFEQEVRACSPETRVVVPTRFAPLTL